MRFVIYPLDFPVYSIRLSLLGQKYLKILVVEEHSPMEIDCKEVASSDLNHDLHKEPFSANGEHLQNSLKILQEFVQEKLHRTVLSLADFKRLLLLRQTGE